MKQIKTNYDRYLEKELKKDPSLKKEIKRAGVAVDISMQLYGLRKERGLTQEQLAKMVGVKQSNVARLENANYIGYSLTTLRRIARALKTELNVSFLPENVLVKYTPEQLSYSTSTDEGSVLYYPSWLRSTVAYQKISIENRGGAETSPRWLASL